MTPGRILPVEMQLVSLLVLVLFAGWVIRLIRTQRLQLRESLIWLLTTIAAMAVTAFPEILVRAATWLGVQVPSNALFGAGLLYLAVNVLSVTIGVSTNTSRLRRLAQECAILRAELEALRAGRDPGGVTRATAAPGATPAPSGPEGGEGATRPPAPRTRGSA